jgi:hypothetical protein
MVGKEKQQEELRAFGLYFPEGDRNQGILHKIKEDLKRIKEITNLEEKYQEASFA